MVTGANQGLGYQTSLELAKRGATLYMVGRRGVAELSSLSPPRAELVGAPPAAGGARRSAAMRRGGARRQTVCGRPAATRMFT